MRVMTYIPSKLLDNHAYIFDKEGLFVEINFTKYAWLLFQTYH